LDIIAAAQPLGNYPLIAVIQAGRKRVALGEYENVGGRWQFKGQIRGATVDELADSIEVTTYIAGELSTDDRHKLSRKKSHVILASPLNSVRRPSVLADLAWARFQNNDVDNAASLAPIYLHVEGTPIL
jgi:tRNA threonylcarbamoyladenosine biosynthesis protein TsaB